MSSMIRLSKYMQKKRLPWFMAVVKQEKLARKINQKSVRINQFCIY